MNHLGIINQEIHNHCKALEMIDNKFKSKIISVSKALSKSLKKGGTIYWCGNGGSASDSMHLSTELIGRLKKNRKPLKSISLSSNASALTCISNDFGFENLFSRQIEALGKKNDVLVAISTSGNSKNILKAIKQAKRNKLFTIGMLGKNGGKCKNKSDIDLIVKSSSTARIQEMHIMIGQIICELIEKELKL
jgi:D-sedoheptulose 7-phosphate isomerase